MKACFSQRFNQRLLQGTRCVFLLAEDMDSVRSSCRKAWATSARIQVVERRLLHSADDYTKVVLVHVKRASEPQLFFEEMVRCIRCNAANVHQLP